MNIFLKELKIDSFFVKVKFYEFTEDFSRKERTASGAN